MYSKWVIDATMGFPFCFCPLDGADIVTGLNLLAADPPGELVGIVHADGQSAVDEFYKAHKSEIDAIRERTRSSDDGTQEDTGDALS